MLSPYSLAIAGGGLTGTSVLYQFVRMAPDISQLKTAAEKIRVAVFEKNETPGPGMPFTAELNCPFHITNMPIDDMSIAADRPDDFREWYNLNRTGLVSDFPELEEWFDVHPDPDSMDIFLPRMIVGEYLKARLNDALETASQKGIEVSVKPCVEIIRIRKQGRFYCLYGQDRHGSEREFKAQQVVMATGHWFSGRTGKNYFPSPWPASKLKKQIPEGSEVAVIGTSLSAVDAALTLFSNGSFKRASSGKLCFSPAGQACRVTLVSRNGMLPRVRGRSLPYSPEFFIPEAVLRCLTEKTPGSFLDKVLSLATKELETAYQDDPAWKASSRRLENPLESLIHDIELAQKGDNKREDILYQNIISAVVPAIRLAYMKLSEKEKKRFNQSFKSIFMNHAVPIPLINARKIAALMTSDHLTIKRLGASYKFYLDDTSHRYIFSWKTEKGEEVQEAFDAVVDARGQSSFFSDNPSKLAKDMLSSGLFQSCPDSGGKIRAERRNLCIDPETFQIQLGKKHEKSGTSSKIFGIGVMNLEIIINASMASECARAAGTVCRQVLGNLCKPPLNRQALNEFL